MKHSRAVRATIVAIILFIGAVMNPSPFASSARKSGYPTVTLTVRASSHSEAYSKLTIDSPRLAKAIARSESAPTEEQAKAVPAWPDVEVVVEDKAKTKSRAYWIDRSGNLLDESTSRLVVLPPESARKLLAYAASLRSAHYGELVRWEEAQSIVGRKTVFTVTDLETGLSYRVQRRAGSDHADVQPISKEDSRIMKEIYGGAWSWDRRAVVVSTGGRRIAASMNGMPHGGDGIPGNGFKGHSCIHFLESTSHKSDVPDPAHQLMVNKAAGYLQPYLDSASPFVLAASFIEALHQRDAELLGRIWQDMPRETLSYYEGVMNALTSIRVSAETLRKQPEDGSLNDLTATVDMPITIYAKGKSGHRTTYRFSFARESRNSPWHFSGVNPPGYSSLMP